MWLCLLLAFLLCLGIQELMKKSQQKEKQNIPRKIGFKIQVLWMKFLERELKKLGQHIKIAAMLI